MHQVSFTEAKKIERFCKYNIQLLYHVPVPYMLQLCLYTELSFVQGYQHVDYLYTLCKDCHFAYQKHQKIRKFIRISRLSHSITSDIVSANANVSGGLLEFKGDIQRIFMEEMIEQIFEGKKLCSRKSTTTTVSTQDSEIESSEVKEEKTKSEIIIEKYQATVSFISNQIEPVKDSCIKAKETLIRKTADLKQSFSNAKTEYFNFSAELPPIKTMAVQTIKKGIGSIFGKFF